MWWAEKERVSGPDGSEEGRWGDIIKTQEMRNPKIIRKRAKSRKCRKDQSSKRKIQNRILATTQTGRRQSRKRKGNRKESEMNGEGCEEGQRGARKRTS